ncbi:MAG: RNA-binding protein [Rhodobacteraceae bacterium]|nr:RNA-binding protein [Paracoccaceae bacterium]MCY4140990.1 RNA-binding protein [Paracoccaceae bacterium]
MSRGGRKKHRECPRRRCIVTGISAPRSSLIRFVVGPERTIIPDVRGNLPGRGIWVAPDAAALERAAGRKLFSRAARMAVEASPSLVNDVDAILSARVVELIALARKAGKAVSGFEKTRALVRSGRAAILFHATDGSGRERSRLPGSRGHATAGTLFRCLSGAEMGLAFGRERVIHAAMAKGGLSDRIVADARRLSRFRGAEPARVPDKQEETESTHDR